MRAGLGRVFPRCCKVGPVSSGTLGKSTVFNTQLNQMWNVFATSYLFHHHLGQGDALASFFLWETSPLVLGK